MPHPTLRSSDIDAAAQVLGGKSVPKFMGVEAGELDSMMDSTGARCMKRKEGC